MGINKAAILLSAGFLMACTAPMAIAQPAAQSATPARTIIVTGQGLASAAPDMAILSIGVRTSGKTAALALRQNSGQMNATIKKLKGLKVATKDIQTSGLSIRPQYDHERNRRNPPIIGYIATNTLTVRLRDLAKAGTIIDEAMQSGANSLGSLSFTFADPKPLYEAARRDAVADAQAKAALLTKAAGVKLGQLITIQSGHTRAPSSQPMAARLEMADTDSVPVAAGESSVSASVTLIYELD